MHTQTHTHSMHAQTNAHIHAHTACTNAHHSVHKCTHSYTHTHLVPSQVNGTEETFFSKEKGFRISVGIYIATPIVNRIFQC